MGGGVLKDLNVMLGELQAEVRGLLFDLDMYKDRVERLCKENEALYKTQAEKQQSIGELKLQLADRELQLKAIEDALPEAWCPGYTLKNRVKFLAAELLLTNAQNREELENQLKAIKSALPKGFFSDRSIAERVEKLSDSWRRLIKVNKKLQDEIWSRENDRPAKEHPSPEQEIPFR